MSIAQVYRPSPSCLSVTQSFQDLGGVLERAVPCWKRVATHVKLTVLSVKFRPLKENLPADVFDLKENGSKGTLLYVFTNTSIVNCRVDDLQKMVQMEMRGLGKALVDRPGMMAAIKVTFDLYDANRSCSVPYYFTRDRISCSN
jgi:hypothetical protein